MRLFFIYNPKSGKTYDSGIQAKIKAILGQDHQSKFIHIHDLGQIDELLPCDAMIAIGGDGTVNTVADYCVKHQKPMGIIPRGSGDGLARHIGVPYDLNRALGIVLKGTKEKVDTASINGRFFVNIAGSGFEAVVAHEFGEKAKQRGFWGYFNAIRHLYFSYPMQSMQLQLGREHLDIEFFSLSIANGSQWGNDFEVASLAEINDGMLDIAVMKKPHWYQILALINYLRKHDQVDNRWMSYYRSAELRITTREQRWHIDGEPVLCEPVVEIKVQPLSLTIFTPHG